MRTLVPENLGACVGHEPNDELKEVNKVNKAQELVGNSMILSILATHFDKATTGLQ